MIINLKGEDVRIDPLAIFSPNGTLGYYGLAYKQVGEKVLFYCFEKGKSYLADPNQSIKMLPAHYASMCENNWWQGINFIFIDRKAHCGEVGVINSGRMENNTPRLHVTCGSVGLHNIDLSQIALTGHINAK